MGGRGFCVKIELDLQAITCPGVWLCPNGMVALRTNMFDSRIESRRLSPAFPLLYHDKFRFKKLFTGVGTLAELQNSLQEECLYTELVQWSSPRGTPVVLATFQTNLADLLYPAACFKGRLLAGSEVDLLMEPSKYFPGILAPKIEISTRTIIEEVIGILERVSSGGHVINPKTMNSKTGTSCVHRKRPPNGIIRQRKVCHTREMSESQPNRPLRRHSSTGGAVSSSSSSSSSSSPSSVSNHCSRSHHLEYHHRKSRGNSDLVRPATISRSRQISPFPISSHAFENCPVCSKYKCYFAQEREERTKSSSTSYCNNDNNGKIFHKTYDPLKCSRRSCIEPENEDAELKPRNPPHEASSRHDAPLSSTTRTKPKELPRQNDISNYVTESIPMMDYSNRKKVQGRRGFYKNLEKFYKRMYKQAKVRAEQVDCT